MSMNSRVDDSTNMDAYVHEGKRRAYELGNRGPIRFNADGTLDQEIIDAYWRCGFYVLEGALADEELNDLLVDMESGLERAPYTKDATVDAQGPPRAWRRFGPAIFPLCKAVERPLRRQQSWLAAAIRPK